MPIPGEVNSEQDEDDPTLVGDELTRVRPHGERLAHYVKADALRKKGKYRELLLVYAADAEAAEARVEALLPEYARRWRLVETFPAREGVETLEYLVRFKNQAEIGELLHRLAEEDDEEDGDRPTTIRAVELKSVRGLRALLS